ncbi:hypothetical protein E6P09_01705 [Haloferax mediterranei ATCC 33500]|uniref:Uncharacterized protein n=1 Tax=Haloferax mediterranei (strain ATCC 33500 / DSM 1411 / JCM 8866 / NBRC 14739 / NCIMB 2177 / R-4) TaxID=523841 RepID=I3R630_HALMT|nr:hypothetical protein [Haloferax mediterranei]AFK19690.1 hypothetical protein HFX_1998 [Haloferax mediterranei ATCC 33500]AHZ23079.1 hypothetical protein BM92_10725 [Haloferax mediterranei ATCC 33500]EMA00012.1 hypothetical protein C439_11768 [Haloferax mediterranei ATCC 33500]MDX5987567.1 hypothetical protein [Haloferax mediterranei ATCC 33500]QCQ74061.1 hypothetical protein E6P09_01705 [Haloferax mediterranei ATCC 33500]
MVPSLRTSRGISSVVSLGIVGTVGYTLLSPRPPTETQLAILFVLSVCLGAASLWMLSEPPEGDA